MYINNNAVYFKNKTKSLMTLFRYYLQDNNGTIENEELRGFLKDLLELVKKVCIRSAKVFVRNNDSFIISIIFIFIFTVSVFIFRDQHSPNNRPALALLPDKIDFRRKFENYTFICYKELNAT